MHRCASNRYPDHNTDKLLPLQSSATDRCGRTDLQGCSSPDFKLAFIEDCPEHDRACRSERRRRNMAPGTSRSCSSDGVSSAPDRAGGVAGGTYAERPAPVRRNLPLQHCRRTLGAAIPPCSEYVWARRGSALSTTGSLLAAGCLFVGLHARYRGRTDSNRIMM